MADAPGRRRNALASLLVFALSIGACLAFIRAYPVPPPQNDAVEYLSLARNLAAGNGFSTDGISPSVYRPPLFSMILGGWFFITGSASVESAACLQALLHAMAAVAAYFLYLELAPFAWALAGALFVALQPMLITRVVFVLQEPTLVLSTTLAVLATVRMAKRPSSGRAALAGASWGLCTLGKSVAWFAPFLVIALRFLPGRLRVPLRARHAVLLAACFAAAIAPWTARNLDRFHRFIPVNAQGKGVLEWNVERIPVPGEADGRLFLAELDRRGVSPAERARLVRERVLRHPRIFLVDRVIRNAVHFAAPSRGWWLALGLARPGEHGPAYWILAGLFHLPLYLMLFYRAWQWGRGALPPEGGVCVAIYFAYWAEHAIVWGDPRYGLAVYPVLLAVALSGGAVSARGSAGSPRIP